jgi:SAM-dependent methyltransferase
VCGQSAAAWLSELGREQRSCACGSTVRLRAVVHLLSEALFGESIILPEFPRRREIRGLGMSDAVYPPVLSRKVSYVNTFYDRAPRLDITAPLRADMLGAFDFVISTEVMEHVAPPVERGFQNLRRLLRPSGVLILTVPYTLAGSTVEHFPELHRYRIIREGESAPVLKNVTVDGGEQVFRDLVFHQGEGATLEMRLFSKIGLRQELQRAGFERVEFFSEPYWEYGIQWAETWSLPLTASPLTIDAPSPQDRAGRRRNGS